MTNKEDSSPSATVAGGEVGNADKTENKGCTASADLTTVNGATSTDGLSLAAEIIAKQTSTSGLTSNLTSSIASSFASIPTTAKANQKSDGVSASVEMLATQTSASGLTSCLPMNKGNDSQLFDAATSPIRPNSHVVASPSTTATGNECGNDSPMRASDATGAALGGNDLNATAMSFTDLGTPKSIDDKKRKALEMRLRTVRDILKHQEANLKHQEELNAKLMTFITEAERWMSDADFAMRRHNIMISAHPPPTFLSMTSTAMTSHGTVSPSSGANLAQGKSRYNSDKAPAMASEERNSDATRYIMNMLKPGQQHRDYRQYPPNQQLFNQQIFKSSSAGHVPMLAHVSPMTNKSAFQYMDWECDSENEDPGSAPGRYNHSSMYLMDGMYDARVGMNQFRQKMMPIGGRNRRPAEPHSPWNSRGGFRRGEPHRQPNSRPGLASPSPSKSSPTANERIGEFLSSAIKEADKSKTVHSVATATAVV